MASKSRTETAVEMPFDLSDIDAVDESKMTVVANGRPTGWIWTFAGPGHVRAIEQANRVARERLAKERSQEQAQVNGKKWRPPEETPDEALARNVGFVVERLLGWSDVTMAGEPFPFTLENARKILSDRRKSTLLLQALEFLGDEHAFTKRSANN
jgi:hypothetical protein